MRRRKNSKRLALLLTLVIAISLFSPVGSVVAEDLIDSGATDDKGNTWIIHYSSGDFPEYDETINGSMEDQIIEEPDEINVTLSKNAYTRDGYSFVGWSNTPDGKSTENVQAFNAMLDDEQILENWTFTRDTDEDEIPETHDISYAFNGNMELTLYAQWSAIPLSTSDESDENENTMEMDFSNSNDIVNEDEESDTEAKEESTIEDIDPVSDDEDDSLIPIYNPREHDSSDILSGTWGTCPWRITSDGVLTIGAGVGTDLSGSVSGSPWYSKRGYITMVRAEQGVVFPENVAYLFKECVICTTVDLSGCDTSNVINMSHLFDGSYNITSIDFSGINTENVQDMSYMFYNCSALPEIDLSAFNTSSVTNMSYLFYDCKSLTSIDVTHFDTRNVISMYYMFYDCSSLTDLDVTTFDVANVESMGFMFARCKGLTTIDLSNFHTESLTAIRGMFYECSGLIYLDLSALKTDAVSDFYAVFYGCSNLTSIDLSNFSMFNAGHISLTYLFHDCNKLKRVKIGPKYFSSKNGGSEHLPYGTYALWYSENGLYGPYMPKDLKSIFLNSEEDAMAMSGWWRIEGDGYLINFDPNGSTGETVTQNVLTNVYTDLNANEFFQNSYDFIGWNTKADGSGMDYSDGEYIYNLVETGESITLYAQWKKQTGTIVLSSKVTGTAATNIPFTFEIYLDGDSNAPVNETFGDYTFKNGFLSLTLCAGESVEIGGIPFAYTYKIEQINIPAGYTTIQSKYIGTIEKNQTVDIVFENEYSASGTADIEAEVILCGGEVSNYSFSFHIIDENENIVSSGTSDQDGKVVFEPISYTMADNGKTYTYTAIQNDLGQPGISLGTMQQTVSVIVLDKGNGTINAEIIWDEGSNLFINQLNTGSLPETGKTSWMQLVLMLMTIVFMIGIAATMTKKKNNSFKL